jgi:hypothetical protein
MDEARGTKSLLSCEKSAAARAAQLGEIILPG